MYTKNLQTPEGAWRFVVANKINVDSRSDPRGGLDDVDAVYLFALPLFGFGIKGGVDEGLPVFIINIREIRPVVEALDNGILSGTRCGECGSLHTRCGGSFPSTHQFVQVSGGHLLSILAHQTKEIQTDVEQFAGGHVIGCYTTTILVGSLHQAHHQAGGFYIVGVDIPVAVDPSLN
jgi:hypothetical protein